VTNQLVECKRSKPGREQNEETGRRETEALRLIFLPTLRTVPEGNKETFKEAEVAFFSQIQNAVKMFATALKEITSSSSLMERSKARSITATP
jgi:hypothetical protein